MPKKQSQELRLLTPEVFSLSQPDLPTVPDAFRRTDYEGFLEEVIKGFQLRRYQRTQAERLTVLKQINSIQAECLALAKNEANWRHFRQEDRIRQKQLDVQELEADMRLEDLAAEREARAQRRAAPPELEKPRDPVAEITRKLSEAIATQAGAKEVFAQMRRSHPEMLDWLVELEARVMWDLKERKWF